MLVPKKTKEPVLRRKEAPEKIEAHKFFGIPLNEEQLEFANQIWSDDIDIVFCNSAAGTGKSTVATGTAKLLVDYGKYDSIVYIMSPYGERQQGWLPGTIEEKSSVYFDAFYQALHTIGVNINTDVVQEADPRQKSKEPYINCITDTYLRGCNLNHAVVIIDEAQNFTVPQLKKILTRVCKDTKVIVIGHNLQCDLYRPSLSGFTTYIEHFEGMERCSVCNLVVNHRGWISNHADSLRENGNPVEPYKNPD